MTIHPAAEHSNEVWNYPPRGLPTPLSAVRVTFTSPTKGPLTDPVRRNALCPCASGRKFKACCLRKAASEPRLPDVRMPR